MKASKITSLALSALLAVTAFGCGEKKESGSIAADGSTSMEKVIGSLGEAFTEKHSGISFTYNPTGSGSGISAVSEGRCDIGLSSRYLKDEEKEKGLIGTILAYDGIAVIVNHDNPISDLDIETLSDIFTGKIDNWSEIGGNDSEIVLIGREAGSGTRDGFESVTGTEGKCSYRQELTSTGDVITTVSQNPSAIGYASIASVKDNVKVLSVGGVYPSEETIRDESYAVQRPFILVTRENGDTSEAVQSFMEYVFSDEAREIILQAGAVPAE